MIDAIEETRRMFEPFEDVAKLVEQWSMEPEGYRWDEPLVVEVWQKLNGSFYAKATRKELSELLSPAKSADEALSGFLMRFQLEQGMWRVKSKAKKK